MLAAAEAAVTVGGAEVECGIAAGEPPSETDHTRQLALSAQALRLSRDAMDQILTVLGGNGLRESGTFQRRYRDVMAMPLHINAHPDRVRPSRSPPAGRPAAAPVLRRRHNSIPNQLDRASGDEPGIAATGCASNAGSNPVVQHA